MRPTLAAALVENKVKLNSAALTKFPDRPVYLGKAAFFVGNVQFPEERRAACRFLIRSLGRHSHQRPHGPLFLFVVCTSAWRFPQRRCNNLEETRATVGNLVCLVDLLVGLITDVTDQADPEVLRDHRSCRGRQVGSHLCILDRGTASASLLRCHLSSNRRSSRLHRLARTAADFSNLRLAHDRCRASAPTVQRDRRAADVDEMNLEASISRCSGMTGVGKSSAVALILQQLLDARPDLRFFVLEVHTNIAAVLPTVTIYICN